MGEECTEVIIGGRKEDKEETIYEIADLTYHVMVLMVQMGITVEDITRELEKRHVVDHKVKQGRMQRRLTAAPSTPTPPAATGKAPWRRWPPRRMRRE